jgi:hypothetical protein
MATGQTLRKTQAKRLTAFYSPARGQGNRWQSKCRLCSCQDREHVVMQKGCTVLGGTPTQIGDLVDAQRAHQLPQRHRLGTLTHTHQSFSACGSGQKQPITKLLTPW